MKDDHFQSFASLVKAYFRRDFNPSDYAFFIRGSELFINDRDGNTVFERECGQLANDICQLLAVEPEFV